MKPFVPTIILTLMITTNILAAPKINIEDFDVYNNRVFGHDVAIRDMKPNLNNPFDFRKLKYHPDVRVSGANFAVLEEIARLRALANQDVYVGRGPDRLGRTVYGTAEPVPGSGTLIYEKRGLRPNDLQRLRNLLASLIPEQTELPLFKRLVEAFEAVSSSALNIYEYPSELRPKKVSAAINSLDALGSVSGLMKTTIELGKGSEKLTIVYVDGKPYIVDRTGNLLNSVPVNALERKFSNIIFEKFPIENFLKNVKKGGGTAGAIAVSALVPILLSNAMVGDANAATSKQNAGSSSSTGVISKQPYIESTVVNAVK
ncbi:MAG: hypothetical protein JNL11_03500 [Bdellovibrionaceae bacterium]|nr:hypothetical protein [Pseudobdellovibrionaceae bacterium]